VLDRLSNNWWIGIRMCLAMRRRYLRGSSAQLGGAEALEKEKKRLAEDKAKADDAQSVLAVCLRRCRR